MLPGAILTAMASPRVPAKKHDRRTQAERRAVTRTALLDATIDCLVEDGYARTSTRRIAERAGVTLGAVHHHFGSKVGLLGEARRYITTKWSEELLSSLPIEELPDATRHEVMLDHAWESYKGRYFQAALELVVAARTDPELRETGADAIRHLSRWNEVGAPVSVPELAGQPGLVELMETFQATMRGLALLTFGTNTDPDAAWPATRAHLLALGALFAAGAERDPS
jgi:AcrR family transcriptional regulator